MQTYTEFLKAAVDERGISAGDKALYAGAMGAGALAGLPQYRKFGIAGTILNPIAGTILNPFPVDRRLWDRLDTLNDHLRRAGRTLPNTPKFKRLAEFAADPWWGATRVGFKRLGAGLGLSLAGAYAGKKAVDFLRSKKYKD